NNMLHLCICLIYAVALRCRGQINTGLTERQIPFRMAEEPEGFHCSQCNPECVWIRIPYILRGKSDHSPCNVKRVFSGRKHSLEPRKSRLRIAAPQAFVKCGYEVVVLFAGLVIQNRLFLERFFDILPMDPYALGLMQKIFLRCYQRNGQFETV